MNSLGMVWLVMSREVRQRVRSRGFKVTTAFLCLAVLGGGVLSRAVRGDDEPTRYDVAVIGAAPRGFADTVQDAARALGIKVRLTIGTDAATAEQGVRDGKLDAAINPDTGALIAESAPSDQLAAVLATGWQSSASAAAAREAGLDDEEIAAILSPAGLSTTLIGTGGADDDNLARAVGFAAAVLLFISINAFVRCSFGYMRR